MKFNSKDTKHTFPFKIEIRKNKNKIMNNFNKNFEQESKTQNTKNNFEHLKKSLSNSSNNINTSYVNPLKITFQKKEEEKILLEQLIEKKKKEQLEKKRMIEEYKKKQQKIFLSSKNRNLNSENKNSFFKNSTYINNNNTGNNNLKKNYSNYNNNKNNIPNFNKTNVFTTGLKPLFSTNNSLNNKNLNNKMKKNITNNKDKNNKKKLLKKNEKENFSWKNYLDSEIKNKNNLSKKKMNIKSKNCFSNSVNEDVNLEISTNLLNLILNTNILPENVLLKYKEINDFLLKYNFSLDINLLEDIQKEMDNLLKIDNDSLSIRPIVVCVLGHVNHGKTSFLDKIKNTRVVDKEAGNITQEIHIYSVDNLFFIDTPGHSVFDKIRDLAINVTDIIILIIDITEGIKEQTKEILEKIYNKNIIIVLTKVDKVSGSIKENLIHQITNNLYKYNLIIEKNGGNIPLIEVSNLTGEGINDVFLYIEVIKNNINLKYNSKSIGKGIVINAWQEKGRGIVASILLQQGSLKIGDNFIAGKTFGKVKNIIKPTGLKVCEPKDLIEINGFNNSPISGDNFIIINDEKLIKNILLIRNNSSSNITNNNSLSILQNLDKEKIYILLKTDTLTSLEAVSSSILKINCQKILNIFSKSIGNLVLSDAEKALEFKLIIVVFNTSVDKDALSFIQKNNIKLIEGNVIYKILEEIILNTKTEEIYIQENIVGTCEVKQIFAFDKQKISGCRVLNGSIFHSKNHICEVKRNGKVIFKGNIISMKHNKDNIKEAKTGIDVGIILNNFQDYELKDEIICYQIIKEIKLI